MGKHFEFTGDTLEWEGHTLHRIRATRNLPFHGVDKGDLGGWVESMANLHDQAWVGDESKVWGNARMYDNSGAFDNTSMSGHTRMSHNALRYNNASMSGSAHMWGNSRMFHNTSMSGYASMTGDTSMYDNASMSGKAYMSGDSSVSSYGELTSELHNLSGTIYTSRMFSWTLNRVRGGGHLLNIGCETGTLDSHQALCDSYRWVETTDPNIIAAARPEYQAVIDLCRARVARWTD